MLAQWAMLGRCRQHLAACALACAALIGPSTPAHAGDGAYGRIDGDVSWVLGLGAGLESSRTRSVGLAHARVRYLESVGVYAHYDDAQLLGAPADLDGFRRAFGAGVEIRPLFPVRFLKDLERGPAFGDLLLDSFGLELGVSWRALGSDLGRPGLRAGVALEWPLFGRAEGLWLRTSASWIWSGDGLEGHGPGAIPTFGVTLDWHGYLGAHVVDATDRSLLR